MSPAPYTVDIVSPQFPCGAAWLANALLELDVALPELWGFDTSREWSRGPDGASTYSAVDLPWRQTLAGLRIGRTFRFRDDVRPRFSHAFPWQKDLAPRIVLVVRDPRDALYSEWQRHRRNLDLAASLTLAEFVDLPFFGGPIPMIDMLWVHLHTWLGFVRERSDRTYLLRFEDWKRDPVGALRGAALWMGFDASADALRRAADASDVSHLQAIEASLRAQDRGARQFNRGGIAEEWRTTWTAAESGVFGVHWHPVFEMLRYELPAIGVDRPTRFDAAKVLAWRGVTGSDETARWQRSITPPLAVAE